MIGGPTTLVIARHGEAHCNRDQTIGGRIGCRGLTDRGRHQVDQLADWLRAEHLNPDVVYTSPLRRAAESAALIAGTLDLTTTVEADLREQDHGQADGRTWTQVLAGSDAIPALAPDRPLAPDGETWRDYLYRATAALARILARHPGQRILIFGHGDTADAAFHLFLRLPAETRAHGAFALHNAAISVWRQQPLAWTRPRSRMALDPHGPQRRTARGEQYARVAEVVLVRATLSS